jgi:hypothetical protein
MLIPHFTAILGHLHPEYTGRTGEYKTTGGDRAEAGRRQGGEKVGKRGRKTEDGGRRIEDRR